ncbi:MAG: long-chain fatty acid--CoA ligase [Candidatus Marinimicrobia bacterium]|nr:long-chain fatty acid--CoA ligase [Candidatus Neomarinimicrobiota bacterium]MCH7763864.1 long-chain fatty acid--CoA ligase [Candidatus Neomarinimicrobiota bacterium]
MSYKTIPDMFFHSVEKYADNPCLFDKINGVWDGRTYREIGESVENIACGLASLGIKKGDKIAILSTNSSRWAIADYAITGLGAVTVTVYPTLTNPHITYICNDSETKYAFVENAEQLDKTQTLVKECKKFKGFIMMDDSESNMENVIGFSTLIEKGKTYKKVSGFNFRDHGKSINEDDLLTLIYTSGTTGNPKGAMLSHKNLVSNVKSGRKAIYVDENDVFLSFLPLSHVYERMAGHFSAFSSGASTYYAESVDTVAENMGEVRPTIMISVPRLYEKMYARIVDKVNNDSSIKQKIFWWAIKVGKEATPYLIKQKRPGGILGLKLGLAEKLVFSKIKEKVGGRLRFFASGGAPLSKEIAEFFASANILILEGYGLTETSPVISTNTQENVKFGTVGKPIDGVEVKIAPDGEILCRGDNVMMGYYNNPEATAEVIDQDNWFYTGDIGEIDDEGFLRITDRKKNIIVTSGGKNIAPAPMETALIMSKYIEQSIIIGDKRNFISALIVPTMENVNKWAEDHGLSKDLLNDPKIIQLFENEIKESMKNFAKFETVKKFKLIPDEWSVDSGELTPTLKVKRKVVVEKYAELIDSIYKE